MTTSIYVILHMSYVCVLNLNKYNTTHMGSKFENDWVIFIEKMIFCLNIMLPQHM